MFFFSVLYNHECLSPRAVAFLEASGEIQAEAEEKCDGDDVDIEKPYSEFGFGNATNVVDESSDDEVEGAAQNSSALSEVNDFEVIQKKRRTVTRQQERRRTTTAEPRPSPVECPWKVRFLKLA